ncbi:MAG TPA: imidazole glycerol phosphate synthase subunit HisH [Bacteroidales bacterium]|nr:imidazole glycerol phosphate synthase subunit HisH [Bacteroidales bacterium]HQI69308.1 imidazole glycerol phosphate synthase subunit HisH [Bacteroidales bacterium]
MIVIVDYGMGNIGSIVNMIKKAGGESMVTSDPQLIGSAGKIIIPGVGAFDNGMKNLKEKGLIEVLNKKVLEEHVPVLGICLGMQLMAKSSEEGVLPGLGWIDAVCKKFRFDEKNSKLCIPHMGWNDVIVKNKEGVFRNMYDDASFYFVHSYYVECRHPEDIAATTMYGIEFTSGLQRGNMVATQFHPEKSHKYGLLLMKNFVEAPYA